MAICDEMYESLRAAWLEVEGGSQTYTGEYPQYKWSMSHDALAELRVEDSRGVAHQGFLRQIGPSQFEYMGVPISESADEAGFRLIASSKGAPE